MLNNEEPLLRSRGNSPVNAGGLTQFNGNGSGGSNSLMKKSEFARLAAGVGAEINSTAHKLEKLTKRNFLIIKICHNIIVIYVHVTYVMCCGC